MANITTIPAHLNFLETLAAGILKQAKNTDTPLPSYKIFLPNRRSCQNLRDAFLDLSDGEVLLLPQIRPLGDVEEEELYFASAPDIAEKLVDLPPALSPTRRQFYLVRLIRKMDTETGAAPRPLDQILGLAQALGALLDQIIIEELSFTALEQIVPEEFAGHWQITLDFLKILKEAWPQILAEEGAVDMAERRNMLLDLQSAYWHDHPPQTPVIVAGSTGTMPATARLMKVIASLPRGELVLPGLDLELDKESWDALAPSHPQSLFQDLFEKLGITRADVQLYNSVRTDTSLREKLVRDMMRPAETVYKWREREERGQKALKNDLSNISLYECDTLRQEAFTIALKLRQTLEDKSKTAALVTPDRNLAAQVKMICERWSIALDDTGGSRLSESAVGRFILLSLTLFQEAFRPSVILGLLKHPLCTCGKSRQDVLKDIADLDYALRGPLPRDVLSDFSDSILVQYMTEMQEQFSLFSEENAKSDARSLETYLHAHISLLEQLTRTDTENGAERLWQGEAGEAAADLFQKLLQESDGLGQITAADYLDLMRQMMKTVLLRPKYGTHPRLLIMGQIEARLMKADVMILGGLNEGTWPALPSADPWMSRPMREGFGLPDTERHIALAAHDFSQAFSAGEVVLTRTLTQDGTPSVPARWLQRMEVVLSAYGVSPDILQQGPLKTWAQEIDKPDGTILPAQRPAPKPVLMRRPTSLPVTAIESWMRDPYSLYAKYILGLRPLDEIEKASDAAQRGSWLHDIFEWFVRSYPQEIPEDAVELMLAYARSSRKAPQQSDLFLPRLNRLLDWFVAQESNWRKVAQVLPELLEAKGAVNVAGLHLHAKADRIDRMTESRAGAIIDYKTGRVPPNTDIVRGLSPQMSLEGLILEKQGFGNVQKKVHKVESLRFWKLSGGLEAGKEQIVKGRNVPALDELIAQASQGLEALIVEFHKEETPYFSLPDSRKTPPEEWQDYAQLARVQEWATLDEGEAV